MRRFDIGSRTRVALTGLFVAVPSAYAAIVHGISPLVAFPLSGAVGVGILVAWARLRGRRRRARVRQAVEAAAAASRDSHFTIRTITAQELHRTG